MATQEKLFSAFFEQSPEAAAVVRISDGTLVHVNREWLALTGFTLKEAVGSTSIKLGLWDDPAQRAIVISELRRRGHLFSQDVAVWFKDRSIGQRLARISGTLIEEGGEQYALIYMKDITAERMAEDAVRSGEQALAQANEELTAQLELYALTEELAQVGYWISDGSSVRYSPGLQKLTGFGPNPSITAARSLIHPDDRDIWWAARESLDGRIFEFRDRLLDGSVHWRRGRMIRREAPSGKAIVYGFVLDVTAEVKATQALREQLAFVEKITSHVPDMLFQYEWRDDEEGGGHSVFPFVSANVQELFGITPEEARRDAAKLFALVHPDDMDGLWASMQAAFHPGGVWTHEFRLQLPDGKVRWLRGNAICHLEDERLVEYGSLSDISERKQAEQRLYESEARFRSLTDLSSDWYWEQDEQFRYTSVVGSEDTSKFFGPEVLGKTRWELGALNMTEGDWEAHRKVLEARQPFRDLELLRINPQGQRNWQSVSGLPVFDENGVFRGYRGIGRDITDRKAAEDETQRLAFYDTLTGLPNRRLLLDRLSHAQQLGARNHSHGALLFMDLDNFKDLNDTMGHDMGDMLLQQVARRLKECLRESDTAARFGGDEFVVMLQDLSDDESEAARSAKQVAEKILQSLNTPFDLMGRSHDSSPSIGITLFQGTTVSMEELLKRADMAMYQAKSAGRNTMRFFDPDMQADVLARAALTADLREGLQRDELRLYYQPIVDGNNRVLGYEALVRWQHPQHGLVPPGNFIAMAEKSGLILAVGQWVMQAACRQLVVWSQDNETNHLTLAVNVSARQFRQHDFVDQVLAALDETGANAQLLKLELTESMLVTEVEDAIFKMAQLRMRGVRFALDDFGTGYSSLTYLKRLPIDQLKIDQSFVGDLLIDQNDAAIVRSILALAQSMELQVVAEGVENEGQYRFLLENGCRQFQGYLFGKPAPL